MAVLIAHASIDETGRVSGGKLGDQTTKEVCLRTWYAKPWTFVLRPKNKDIGVKAAKIAVAIANNDNVGYSQAKRNTLYKELKNKNYDVSKLNPCDTDCSAFVTTCYIAAGISSLKNNVNLPTTSTMRNIFVGTSEFEVLSDARYTTKSDYLQVGDVLVKPGSHTVIVVDLDANPYKEPTSTLRKGSKGNGVRWLQYSLTQKGYKTDVDGDFGEDTEDCLMNYQTFMGLEPNGILEKVTRETFKV